MDPSMIHLLAAMGNQEACQGLSESHVSKELSGLREFRFKYRILGLTSLAAISDEDVWPFSSQFGTETNIGLSSATWKMTLALADTDEIGPDTLVNLSLVQTGGLPDLKDFTLNLSVKQWFDPDEDLISVEVDTKTPTKPFGTLQELKDASVGGKLFVHGRFQLHFPPDAADAAIESTTWGMDIREMFDFFFRSGDWLDFVIRVKELGGGDGDYAEIKVHEDILTIGNPVLRQKIVDEGEGGTLTIEDLSPTCVNLMVNFLYTGNLEDGWKDVADELVLASEKYGLPLRNFLDRNLHLAVNYANAWKLRRVAKTHELDIATRAINNFIVTNINEI